jgi:hypothetical protein
VGDYLQMWLSYLKDSHGTAAFPLLVGGVALMLFGWRLWKLCVVLSYGLIGAGAVLVALPESPDRWWYAFSAATILGAASYKPALYAVALLGGLIGVGFIFVYLDAIGMRSPTIWLISGAGLLICTAYALINRRKIVVIVTAFLGAALLTSGLVAVVITSPAMFGWFRSAAEESIIVAPFILLVPTVMSCFYQMGEVRRLQADL